MKITSSRVTLFLLALPALAACEPQPDVSESEQVPTGFWASLQAHCGKAFAGELVSADEVDADFRGAEMVAHFRECSDSQVKIPFHVRQQDGEWDRSRTWVITRHDDGFLLKHDHRHEDGVSDAVTMYGGKSLGADKSTSRDFPVDDESIALFEREDLGASVTNVWKVEVDATERKGDIFAYELRRSVSKGAPADRHFRVEFDLSRTVPAPPAPWGAEVQSPEEAPATAGG